MSITNKNWIIFLIMVMILSILEGTTNLYAKEKTQEMKDKVDQLISKMTLEEKIGQMTQLTLQTIAEQPATETQPFILDVEKLRTFIKDYHIGSFLNVYDVAMTVDDWQKLITQIQDIATKETRLGIPVIYGIDAIHGANYIMGATIFPQSIAMAATRNPDLVEKSAEITALEIRAAGIPWNFNPVLGVGRNPVWPRFFETFGEDPYLVAVMGAAYIKGMEGDDIGRADKVAACMKHYMGYSFPLNGQDRTPAWIPERMLRDIFLPPFAAAVKAGVHTVMVNSSEINGIPAHSDQHILTEILRDELNFKGFTVSDWEDIKRLHTRDKVAATDKEAVRMAVMAGLDMSMVPMDVSFYKLLLELVKEGLVPMSRIDNAVRNILTVKYELGLFENPYPNKDLTKQFATKESDQVSLDAAREAITLLENKDNILPLKKSSKVLVTGPTANLLSVMNGGWTITWQGDIEALYPKDKHTVLQAITGKIGKNNLTYSAGCDFEKDINSAEIIKKAGGVDAIILCLGEKSYCETPGNITDLTLDECQLELAEQLYATAKPVILVLLEGRPRVINKIADKAKAVVMGFLPGMNGGTAIADVLFGDVNPSGKLPFSYPRYPNRIVTYDYKPIEEFDTNAYNPQWPFGYGLSYTAFSYQNLELDKSVVKKGDDITITVKVTNTGKRAGKKGIDLYVTDEYGSVTRPNKQLKGFKKIDLQPGETKRVSFSLSTNDLAFTNRDMKKIVEPGDFIVHIGGLSQSFRLE